MADFAKTQLQCAEAAGLENPATEIHNVSSNAKSMRPIEAVGCVGVVDQFTSWGYDALAAFQDEPEEEHERGADAGANRREKGGRRKRWVLLSRVRGGPRGRHRVASVDEIPVFLSDVIEMVRDMVEEAGTSHALKHGSVLKGYVQ